MIEDELMEFAATLNKDSTARQLIERAAHTIVSLRAPGGSNPENQAGYEDVKKSETEAGSEA